LYCSSEFTLVLRSRIILSLVMISAWRAAVLALDSWRSFSREAILLGRDSRASSYSVMESRIESLAMMESMSAWLIGGVFGAMVVVGGGGTSCSMGLGGGMGVEGRGDEGGEGKG
jgi:hypothetical protein